MNDEIVTPRLLLRRWRAEDRAPFAAMNADPAVMEHFPTTLSASDSDAFVDRIEAHLTEHGYGLWAVEVSGQFIGFTGLSWVTWQAEFTPALEVGWRLARQAWGHGYASEAATAALHRGFQDVPSIVSFTALTNQRSVRVMERIGMVWEADFDHPRVPDQHRLKRHALYRANRSTWPTASVPR